MAFGVKWVPAATLLLFILISAFQSSQASGAGLERNHIVILIDNSGSMDDAHGWHGRFMSLIADQLPEVLCDPGDPFTEDAPIWRADRDVVSVYLFGLTKVNPSFRSGFLVPLYHYQAGFSFDELKYGLQERIGMNGSDKLFGRQWTALSCAIPLGIRRSGAAVPQDMAVARTYVLRISDDRFNGDIRLGDEIQQLQQRHLRRDSDLLPSERLTPRDFEHVSNVCREVERDFLVSFEKTLLLLWNGSELRRRPGAVLESQDNLAEELSVLIKEIIAVPHHGPGEVFDLDPQFEARRLAKGKYHLNAEIRLTEGFESILSDLEPVEIGIKPVAAAGSASGPAEWDFRPPSAGGRVDYDLGEYRKNDLPSKILISGHFRRPESASSSQIVRFNKTVPVAAEPPAEIMWGIYVADWMLGAWPSTPQKVIAGKMRTAFVALIVLVAISLVLMGLFSFVPRLVLAPQTQARDPVVVDFSSLEGNPVLAHSLMVKDTSRKRGIVARSGKLRDVTVVPYVGSDLGTAGKGGVAPLLKRWQGKGKAERALLLVAADEDESSGSASVGSEANDTPRFVLRSGSEGFVRLTDDAETRISSRRAKPGDDIPIVVVPNALQDFVSESLTEINADYTFLVKYEASNSSLLGWIPFPIRGMLARESEQISIPVLLKPEKPTVEFEIVPPCDEDGDRKQVHHLKGEKIHCADLIVRNLGKRSFCLEPHIAVTLFLREESEFGRGVREGSISPDLEYVDVQGADSGLGSDRDSAQKEPSERFWIQLTRESIGREIRIPLLLDCEEGFIENPAGDRAVYVLSVWAASGSCDLSMRNDGTCQIFLNRDPAVVDLYLRACMPGFEDEGEELVTPSQVIRDEPLLVDLATRAGHLEVSENDKSRLVLCEMEIGNAARSGTGYVKVDLSYSDPMLVGGSEGGLVLDSLEQGFVLRERQGERETCLKDLDFKDVNFSAGDRRKFEVLLIPDRLKFKEDSAVSTVEVSLRIDYSVHDEAASEGISRKRELTFILGLQKNLGADYLAVDFGTSALVAAFAEAKRFIGQGRDDALGAVLPLPARLKAEQKEQGKAASATNLISTRVYVRQTGTHDDPRLTVDLPAFSGYPDDGTVIGDWLRFYLKRAIIRNPTQAPMTQELRYRPHGGSNGDIVTGIPDLSDVVIATYKTLFGQYIEPLLKDSQQLAKFRQVVLTHPNNYLVHHRTLLRRWVRCSCNRILLEPLVLSESDAIIFWYLSTENSGNPHGEERIMTYDIGAGTLDISIRRAVRDDHKQVVGVELEHLYTRPGAGDSLDLALAEYIHKFLKDLVESEKWLKYKLTLFGEIPCSDDPYENDHLNAPFRTLVDDFRKQLTNLKIAYSEWGRGGGSGGDRLDFVLEYRRGEALLNVKTKDLDRLKSLENVSHTKHGIVLHLPTSGIEEVVEKFLKDNVDDVLKNALGNALKGRGVDTVVVSGRTSLLYGLKDRVERVLTDFHSHRPPTVIHYGERESKEGVVLGALKWATDWRTRIPGIELPVLYGTYGLVYDCGQGRKWVPFFGPDDQPEKWGSYLGEKIPLFKHRENIRLSGLRYVKYRYSFCPNPEAHLDSLGSPDERTYWGKLEPEGYLGSELVRLASGAKEVTVSMQVVVRDNAGPSIRIRTGAGVVKEVEEFGFGLVTEWDDEKWPEDQLAKHAELKKLKHEPSAGRQVREIKTSQKEALRGQA